MSTPASPVATNTTINPLDSYTNLYLNYDLDTKDFSALDTQYGTTLDESINKIGPYVIKFQNIAISTIAAMPPLQVWPQEESFAFICQATDQKWGSSTPESYQKLT